MRPVILPHPVQCVQVSIVSCVNIGIPSCTRYGYTNTKDLRYPPIHFVASKNHRKMSSSRTKKKIKKENFEIIFARKARVYTELLVKTNVFTASCHKFSTSITSSCCFPVLNVSFFLSPSHFSLIPG